MSDDRFCICWMRGRPETATVMDWQERKRFVNSTYGRESPYDRMQLFVGFPLDPEFTPERAARQYEEENNIPPRAVKYIPFYNAELCASVTATAQLELLRILELQQP
jgi:hypothetical protein